MSSLAAVQADGFYIDPQKFNPSKGKGSANAIAGTHPLGVRASKLKSDGILVIRFEMPYDSVCLRCGHFVSHGVRFNADKRRTGTYLSTPIYSFAMTCPSSCGEKFLIETDPQNATYKYLEGLRRKVKDFIPGAEDGLGRSGGSLFMSQEVTKAREEASRDGIARLQRSLDDKARADMDAAQLDGLSRAAATRRSLDAQKEAWARLTRKREGERAREAQGEVRGLLGPLLNLSPREEDEDLFTALSSFQRWRKLKEEKDSEMVTTVGEAGGATAVPPDLRTAILSQSLSFKTSNSKSERSETENVTTGRRNIFSGYPDSRSSSSLLPLSITVVPPPTSSAPAAPTTLSHRSRDFSTGTSALVPAGIVRNSTFDLPPAVVSMIQAGRKRKAEMDCAELKDFSGSASRIQDYFRSLSGRAPSVTLRGVGPLPPPLKSVTLPRFSTYAGKQ